MDRDDNRKMDEGLQGNAKDGAYGGEAVRI